MSSICCRYVDRFRHSAPMSREQRQKLSDTERDDFWWLEAKDTSSNQSATQPPAVNQQNVVCCRS